MNSITHSYYKHYLNDFNGKRASAHYDTDIYFAIEELETEIEESIFVPKSLEIKL